MPTLFHMSVFLSKRSSYAIGTSSKRKRGSRPVNLSDQAAKKSKPAAVSQTSRDIAVVSNFITERDNKISALKAELEAQKAAAASEKDKLKKKLDQAKYMQSKYELAIKMLAKNKVELARKDDELAQQVGRSSISTTIGLNQDDHTISLRYLLLLAGMAK